MPVARRAGHDVFWREGGTPLLIHGALAHSGIWRDVAAGLAFDLPGHGQSGDWTGGDYHAACTAIAATFLDQPRPVIGHSFGATIALRLAVEFPGLCQSLTLIEPVFFAVARADNAPELSAHDAAMAPFVAALATDDRVEMARAFLKEWGDGRAFDDFPTAQRDSVARRIHLVEAGASVIEHDDIGLLAPGCLDALNMPVHLVRGAQSPPIIGAIHRGLMARLPHARETVIAAAGHMSPVTHPAAVAEVIAGI